MVAPISWIGRLKFRHARHRSRRNTHRLPLVILLLPLAEVTPIHDSRNVCCAYGTEHVGVDGGAIPKLNRHVLLAQDSRSGNVGLRIQLGAEAECGYIR